MTAVCRGVRAVVVVALLFGRARAEPEGSIREEATTDGATVEVDTSMRMRSDAAAVGVGLAGRLSHGDYALTLGVMRWQTLDENASRGSWELALRGYRQFRLGEHVRGHVMAGASYELVEHGDQRFGRVGALIGAGLSWRVVKGMTAWAELTLENTRWLEPPPGATRENELQLMLTLGLSF